MRLKIRNDGDLAEPTVEVCGRDGAPVPGLRIRKITLVLEAGELPRAVVECWAPDLDVDLDGIEAAVVVAPRLDPAPGPESDPDPRPAFRPRGVRATWARLCDWWART